MAGAMKPFKGWAVMTAKGNIATDSSGNSDAALAIYKTLKEAEAMRDEGESISRVSIFMVLR